MSRRGRDTAAFSLFAFQDIITSVTGIMLLVTMLLAVELLQRHESSPPVATAELSETLDETVASQHAKIAELEEQLALRRADLAELAAHDLDNAARRASELAELNRRLQRELAELGRQGAEADQREREIRSEAGRRAADARTLEQLQAELRGKQAQLERLRSEQRVIFNPSAGDAKTPWLVEVAVAGLTIAEVGRSTPPRSFADAAEFLAWARRQDPRGLYFVVLVKPDGIEAYRLVFSELRRLNFDMGFDLLTAGQTAIDPQTGAALE